MQKDVEFYGEIRSAIKKHAGEELDINVSTYAARRTPTGSPNLSTTFPIHREPVASVATISHLGTLTPLIRCQWVLLAPHLAH